MIVKGQMKVCYPKLYNLAHAHLHPLNVLLLPKDQIIAFSLVLLQLVSRHVATLKVTPYFICIVQIIFFFRSFGIDKNI